MMSDLIDVFNNRHFKHITIERAISDMDGILMVDGKENEVIIRLDGDKVKSFMNERNTVS